MISTILFIGAFVSLLMFLLSMRKSEKKPQQETKVEIQQKPKPNYGHLQVFYGSQTGTSAKMAEAFAEQALEKGFQAEVIDLKDIKFEHFDRQGEISIFFLSNTGEGQVPDNAVKFMKVLKKKEDLDEVRMIDWTKVAFTVFGLGNTQYEFYNKTGKDADALLETRGAHRVYQLGLGDNNASMQDDYIEWKNQIWDTLIAYRLSHPLEDLPQGHDQKPHENSQQQLKHNNRKYLTSSTPQLANFRFYICQNESQKMQYTEQDLDFKTKASLKAEQSIVKGIRQVRQNTDDGSTLELQVQLLNQPEYDTAGNIALYPKNDPRIVQSIISYFNFSKEQLDSFVSVEKVHQDKKLKLNFVPYCKLIDLIESQIDVQGRLTKAILKKLSKFPSKDQQYFVTNSSPKTTAEYKRITEENGNAQWYNIVRIVQELQVKIGFEDFVQLCDSIAPRLFTIASSHKKQNNVIVMASIIDQGLISKHFLAKPEGMKAELRKSTFGDAMKWNKVIFISVGTGFAPFRGYLQEKQLLMARKKNGEDIRYPKVTLFFGCKRSNGDFIYKEQIEKWVEIQVIDKFHGAFSRQKQEKVYVQHLLAKQDEDIKYFLHQQTSAIYICGSLSMGHEVSQVLAQKAGGHQKIKELQLKGRIVKQLW